LKPNVGKTFVAYFLLVLLAQALYQQNVYFGLLVETISLPLKSRDHSSNPKCGYNPLLPFAQYAVIFY
jgi:hypothetical protein